MGGTDKKGMENQKVRSIAEQLSRVHRELTDATTNAEKAVRQLRGVWEGDDATTFFGAWPTTKHTLDLSSGGVGALSKKLRQEIGEQELTSGVAGTGGDGDDDGIPDRDDQDDDNDGVPDDKDKDDDNDGTPDDKDDDPVKLPKGPDGLYDPDKDDDGTPDDKDDDDDGDGIKDHDEDPLDDDADGTPDTEDDDDDNDGIKDGDDPEHRQDDPDGQVWEESGFDKPEVTVGTTFLQGDKELWDAQAYGHTFGDEDGNHVSVEALSTEGKIDGQFGLTNEGLVAGGSLTAGAYLAKVEGKYSNSYGTSADGKAYVGAEGTADAGVSLGKDGVRANAGAEVFVGGKAEASVHQEVGPVDVGVGGEISYGIGAHVDANAEVSTDHVGVDFDIGATLGVGGGVKIDIGFDPTPWN